MPHLIRSTLVTGLAFSLAVVLPAQRDPTPQSLKRLPEQAIQVRLRQAEAESKWQADREILSHSIVVMEETLEELDRQIQEKELEADNTVSSLEELDHSLAAQEAGQSVLFEQIDAIETATENLATYAPPPLAQQIRGSLNRLGEGDSPESLSLRIQAVATILTLFDQFNKSYADVRKIHSFESGSKQEVRILYLGLAQAIAVNNNETRAWILTPAPQEWTWRESPEDLRSIATAFQAYDKDIPPQFSSVSATLSNAVSDR